MKSTYYDLLIQDWTGCGYTIFEALSMIKKIDGELNIREFLNTTNIVFSQFEEEELILRFS